MKFWSPMTIEISTYHSLISSSYTLHQPIPEKKNGSSYQNFVLSWFRPKKQVLVNKTFDEAASPQSAKKNVENL